MHEPDRAPDAVRRRLLYRATHRGTHEAELLVGRFVEPRIATISADELDALALVLDLPDPDLADWLTGRRAVPDGLAEPLVTLLRRMKDAIGA